MNYIPSDPMKGARQKRSKYRNIKVKAFGKKFDSAGERDRYFYLTEARDRGQIRNLQRQVEYSLDVNGVHICNYIADFVYERLFEGAAVYQVVEDFKGGYRLPPDWPIKQKLMKACHGIDVRIVKEPTIAIG